MIGIIEAIALLTNKLTFLRSWFALSNLSSLCFSLPKARMTNIPVKFSRIVKLSLSTSFWMILNFGKTTTKATMITPKITIKTIATIHVILGELLMALINAPIPMIGAKAMILNIIIETIWTCVTSFVVLVIKDAVENFENSSFEKLSTFSKTSFLKSLATPAPKRDEQ